MKCLGIHKGFKGSFMVTYVWYIQCRQRKSPSWRSDRSYGHACPSELAELFCCGISKQTNKTTEIQKCYSTMSYFFVERSNLREGEFPSRKEGLQNPYLFPLKICPNPESLFQFHVLPAVIGRKATKDLARKLMFLRRRYILIIFILTLWCLKFFHITGFENTKARDPLRELRSTEDIFHNNASQMPNYFLYLWKCE